MNDSAELVFIQDMLVFAVRDSAEVGLHACNLVFKIVGDREFVSMLVVCSGLCVSWVQQ